MPSGEIESQQNFSPLETWELDICCQIEADSFCIAGISGSFVTTTAVKILKVKAQGHKTRARLGRELGIYIDFFCLFYKMHFVVWEFNKKSKTNSAFNAQNIAF